MHKELLSLVPTKYLCPRCGKWHKWRGKELEHYNSESQCFRLWCTAKKERGDNFGRGFHKLFVQDGYLHYLIESLGCKVLPYVRGKVWIRDIEENLKSSAILFYYHYSYIDYSDLENCKECSENDYYCQAKDAVLVNKKKTRKYKLIEIPLGLKFNKADFERIVNNDTN